MFVLSNVAINSVAKSASESTILVLSAVGLGILFIMYGKSLMYDKKKTVDKVLKCVVHPF
jgi:hypothetical protein